jgi:hypothetical protein
MDVVECGRVQSRVRTRSESWASDDVQGRGWIGDGHVVVRRGVGVRGGRLERRLAGVRGAGIGRDGDVAGAIGMQRRGESVGDRVRGVTVGVRLCGEGQDCERGPGDSFGQNERWDAIGDGDGWHVVPITVGVRDTGCQRRFSLRRQTGHLGVGR